MVPAGVVGDVARSAAAMAASTLLCRASRDVCAALTYDSPRRSCCATARPRATRSSRADRRQL
eukprot:3519640-Prymnesium_polylepis.1